MVDLNLCIICCTVYGLRREHVTINGNSSKLPVQRLANSQTDETVIQIRWVIAPFVNRFVFVHRSVTVFSG